MSAPEIFLSYSRADAQAVVAVQKLLEARGITTFLDCDNLVAGLPWPQALEEGLRRVRGVAVFIGREPPNAARRHAISSLWRFTPHDSSGFTTSVRLPSRCVY